VRQIAALPLHPGPVLHHCSQSLEDGDRLRNQSRYTNSGPYIQPKPLEFLYHAYKASSAYIQLSSQEFVVSGHVALLICELARKIRYTTVKYLYDEEEPENICPVRC
jgi:hypothetical protein